MSKRLYNYVLNVDQIDRQDNDGYGAIDILVPPEVSDEGMACGGRVELLEWIRSDRRAKIGQFCVDCSANDVCILGKVIVDGALGGKPLL